MSICLVRRTARVEIFTPFSLKSTFSRVPSATSSCHLEKRAIPQPSSVDGLDVTAPNPDRAATSKWTSFKLVPYKGVSATTRKGHNINSEVQASPPALKESRAISAADREQAGIA